MLSAEISKATSAPLASQERNAEKALNEARERNLKEQKKNLVDLEKKNARNSNNVERVLRKRSRKLEKSITRLI